MSLLCLGAGAGVGGGVTDALHDVHCEKCHRAKGTVVLEHVGERRGWKCVCGWWNWLGEGLRELDVSGPTALASLALPDGGSEYVRLYVRPDGVVVAQPVAAQFKT